MQTVMLYIALFLLVVHGTGSIFNAAKSKTSEEAVGRLLGSAVLIYIAAYVLHLAWIK